VAAVHSRESHPSKTAKGGAACSSSSLSRLRNSSGLGFGARLLTTGCSAPIISTRWC
jgi:hypothetical protein